MVFKKFKTKSHAVDNSNFFDYAIFEYVIFYYVIREKSLENPKKQGVRNGNSNMS